MARTTQKWRGTALACLTAASTLLTGCSKSSEQEPADSTRRMAKRLEDIAVKMDAAPHMYLNSVKVNYFRHQVDSLGQLGPEAEGQQLKSRFLLANELLRDGQSEKAAQALQQLQLEVADAPQLRQIVQVLLGLAFLRLGEQENCIIAHNTESCLMPIRGAGVHQIQRGSRAAITEFSAVLQRNPGDLTARWLLNIAYMTLGEYPDKVPQDYLFPPEVFDADYDIKRFEDVAPGLGLDTVGLSGGTIMEDFDNDGHLDIMASSWGLRDQIRYFRNQGDGTFADRTQAAGLNGIGGGLNLVHADYDNDGYADVLVLRGAWLEEDGKVPNSLLRNIGEGNFVDATEAAGLLSAHPTQTAAWGDYDNDGWVDLFVGNETFGPEPHPCELYHNNGDGTFTNLAKETGLAVTGQVKGVVWGDYDNDGRIDLYISRLSSREHNLLFRNKGEDATGRWHFEELSMAAGVPGPPSSFPTWFWDYDNDGWLDLFVAGYKGTTSDVAADYLGLKNRGERPRLYRNNGDGTFSDRTQAGKLDKALLAMGCNFGDLDNDGYPDFYIGTGNPFMNSLMPNRMFRNAAGQFFQDVTTTGGFGHLQKGHAVAFGDIDHDGDQDVFAVIGGAFSGDVFANALFENPGHGNHWLKLRLEGVRSNRAAIGARIKVRVSTAQGNRDIYATVSSGSSFGGSSFQQEIGLGAATAIEDIQITWPASGTVQNFGKVAMDQVLHIREGDSSMRRRVFKPFDLSPGDRAQKHHAHQ